MTGPDEKPPGAVVNTNRQRKPLAKSGAQSGLSEWAGERSGLPNATVHSFERAKPSWASTMNYAQALVVRRRRRRLRVLVWFSLIVIFPTLATAGYCFFVATPRFTSDMEITYQTYRTPTSLASGLVQSVTGTSQQNTVDLGTIVNEYIRSSALAEKLDATLHLRKLFSDPKIDWLSRMSPNASRERYLQYFRSHVRPSEGLGGYIEVEVDAFDPKQAQTLAKAVFAASDEMIDGITARARENSVKFAQAELGRQETRLRKARTDLTAFQNLHGDQDPDRAASQLGTIVGSLESDLASTRALLDSSKVSLAPDSPIMTQLEIKIKSLNQQLKEQRARLATESAGKKPYSQVLEEYSALQQEQDFAKSAYTAAQQGLVLARAGADNRQNYVVDFAPPALPERMSYAWPLETTGTVFLLALLVFGGASLLAGGAIS